jgi:hypothetical protein
VTFELLTLTAAKIDSVNCRSELHGKEHSPAVDLRISFDAANSVLDMFDGWLLFVLYHKADAPAQPDPQQALDGVEVVSDTPNLRIPFLASPLKWGREYTGYTLVIDYGIGGKSNVVLGDCAVNNVQFSPKEGGTVTVTMRLQCSKGLNEKVLGKLALLVQHDVHIQLEAPEVDVGAPPIDGAKDGGPWPFGDKGEKNAPATEKTPEQALADAVEGGNA